MATISKGITLGFKTDRDTDTYNTLTNLQEIPELGGDAESIEITVLSDDAHTYTNGILNYGDNLTFKFLYENEQFSQLQGLVATTANNEYGVDWMVTLPDGLECRFSGKHSVKLDGVGINSALTYTLNIKPTTAMDWN